MKRKELSELDVSRPPAGWPSCIERIRALEAENWHGADQSPGPAGIGSVAARWCVEALKEGLREFPRHSNAVCDDWR